jgi:arginine-tRNA-protein transferase
MLTMAREKARLKNTFDLTREVHKAELQNVKQPPEPAHRFEITLEPAEFTIEKYELFKNYQQSVHKEKPSEISQSGFKRFLCESPLKQTSRQVNGKEQLLGSYHQCYRYDGRLVAMGILDLLPHCVSGVYLLYHSDFEQWQFGKLSALREAALALEGGYKYYYMGYYIHSCVKMKYKGDYKTQHVLDPETYEWHPLDDELRGLLDKKAYVSMARERRRKISGDAVDQDDYSDYPMPTAAEAGKATKKGVSLFDLQIPGIMTVDEIEEQLDLDTMPVRVGGQTAECHVRLRPKLWIRIMLTHLQQLASWENSDIRNPHTVRGIIAEMVACMGPEAAWQVVVELG